MVQRSSLKPSGTGSKQLEKRLRISSRDRHGGTANARSSMDGCLCLIGGLEPVGIDDFVA